MRHRKQEQHLANLRGVKPMVDNRDPRRPKASNSKGARLIEERNNQIMHENTILLNKLSRILTRPATAPPAPMLRHGLNENQKKAERERIDRENQALLRRLQDVRPSIDAEATRQDYALVRATRPHTSLTRRGCNGALAVVAILVAFGWLLDRSGRPGRSAARAIRLPSCGRTFSVAPRTRPLTCPTPHLPVRRSMST